MVLEKFFDNDSAAETQIPRYLWAAGSLAAKIPAGQTVADRYRVVAPQIWLDTQPEAAPLFPPQLSDELLPYLRLYPQWRHIPQVYGICPWNQEEGAAEILLLENVPIDANGRLYPVLLEAWSQASATRQVNWLWQLWQLWTHLSDLGVAASLRDVENIRVQGSRLWLRQLVRDRPGVESIASLQELGYQWLTWTSGAQPSVAGELKAICQQMRRYDISLADIATRLNHLLVGQAAQLPLRLGVAGNSDAGPLRSQNEDACYPRREDLEASDRPPNHELLPYLAIVCDGVGGHEGGEVASQMAIESLKPQIRIFLQELNRERRIVPPGEIIEQLSAIVRVVNNTIAAQNDAQGRELRQRMGTTLAMGLLVPQTVQSEGDIEQTARELYVAHVGDSRAYWITRDYCQQLTVDDDVASREVRLGRNFYRAALQRLDGGALTQALGTRGGEMLRCTIARYIVDEDGILLLCSDGLSDNDWVEKSWRAIVPPILEGERSLEAAVEAWISLANENNGHDNTSVAMAYCRISPGKLMLFEPGRAPATAAPESEMTEASKALLFGESEMAAAGSSPRRRRSARSDWATLLLVVVVIIIGGAIGWIGWSQLMSNPRSQPPDSDLETIPLDPPPEPE